MQPSAAPAVIRLLLVDDHPLVRDGLRSRLGAMPGFEVVGEAGDAREALAQLDACAPQIVLMDVGMKDTNGIELAALLLARRPELQVLMFSMYDNPEYVHRALQAGARGYVLKDAPASEIVAAIKAVAGGGTFLSQLVTKRLFRNQAARPVLSLRESQILLAFARGLSSNDGYFFVYDLQGRVLMHSRQPELVGQNLWRAARSGRAAHDPVTDRGGQVRRWLRRLPVAQALHRAARAEAWLRGGPAALELDGGHRGCTLTTSTPRWPRSIGRCHRTSKPRCCGLCASHSAALPSSASAACGST